MGLGSEVWWKATVKQGRFIRAGTGTFLGCKSACSQFMRQEPDAIGKRGTIVNIASVAGLVGTRASSMCTFQLFGRLQADHRLEAAAYCASKAAVISLTRAVALDYAPYEIICNAVCPGCEIISLVYLRLIRQRLTHSLSSCRNKHDKGFLRGTVIE